MGYEGCVFEQREGIRADAGAPLEPAFSPYNAVGSGRMTVPVRCSNCYRLAIYQRHEGPNGWLTQCFHCGYQEFKTDVMRFA